MDSRKTPHPNTVLITTLYHCFQNLDGDGMARCYHENAKFSDPVFTRLHGTAVGDMWRMLCARAHDFSLDFRNVTANDINGAAHWTAGYKFSSTGHRVTNLVESRFKFKDGRIIDQLDSFNFWKWSCISAA
jgi:hypothetical protein